MLCISTVAALVVVLITPTPSVAISQSFDIFFSDGPKPFHTDWTGTFMVDDGIVTAFTAFNVSAFAPGVLGACQEIAKCTYIGGGFPYESAPFPTLIRTIPFDSGFGTKETADLILFGGLSVAEGSYFIHNPIAPSGFGQDSEGNYIIRPIPEPGAWLLMGVGLVGLRLVVPRPGAPR